MASQQWMHAAACLELVQVTQYFLGIRPDVHTRVSAEATKLECEFSLPGWVDAACITGIYSYCGSMSFDVCVRLSLLS